MSTWKRLALLPRQLLARVLSLPPAKNTMRVERNIPIPMRDGEILYADYYWPVKNASLPTVLIRSSWGRGWKNAPFSLLYGFIARLFAERGYHVLLQDTHQRRPEDSPHPMPHYHEVNDGKDTIAWLCEQPWFNGDLGMWGASYMGYVQWAALSAENIGLRNAAIVPVTTSTHWTTVLHPDGALGLNTLFRLQHMFAATQLPFLQMVCQLTRQDKIIAEAVNTLPISEAAKRIPKAKGFDFEPVRETTDVQSDFWQTINLRERLPWTQAKAHMVAGWYDIFLREQIEDYEILRDAGKQPYLTIGPWHHTDQGLAFFSIRLAMEWFDAHLGGSTPLQRDGPVRVYIMGTEEWRTFERWPPASDSLNFFLHRGSTLGTDLPEEESPPDGYRYDPGNPTPSLGGAILLAKPGRQDNRGLEAREDVLVYTTQPLKEKLEVIGVPQVKLYAQLGGSHTDFFARICDVFPDGRSFSVTDGLIRLEPGDVQQTSDGTFLIVLRLWPTAYCFRAGHCIRLQISSGAHPRWNRNSGTGEPFNTGTRMVSVEHRILHDLRHPSELILPRTRL